MRKDFLKKIIDANGDEDLIDVILAEFENEVQEQFIITILLQKRNKKINEKCWNKNDCIFNNDDLKYMKCWQDSYSVDQCKQDNLVCKSELG